MKIFEQPTAPSALRVSLFLAEIDIEVARVKVDIRAGENLTDSFQAKSINGKIPVLELDDGTTICESMAICRYFAELYPSTPSLFGDTALERAQIEMWQRIVELQGLFVSFQAFRNITRVYQDRENCVEAWGQESRNRLIDFLSTLNQQLKQTPYIAGSKFSVADITAYVLVKFMAHLDIRLDNSLPNLQSWYHCINTRPAIQKVLGDQS
ncbi:glutathione S-transferase [Endozoicomonas sp. SM1973]|uniref:Glutathione S-transferase n=1 Tax=Spartinivicinus marinus TaxID=2994442 RepID=A0A853IE92_9GAMM|nr:glutathione S-transferase [Spartinivicinus marinus]MCX4025783.1 glutathione S-transferase [Spartinivicinus marinus]NYZ65776.1 glutathione S-transferase [Spartinivicinus marinus]